jgi:hypothetical protein
MRIHPLAPFAIGFAIAPLFPVHADAQGQPPLRSLTRPEVEFAEPFTRITGVRELSDGRVIVADPQEKTLQIIDMRTGNARSIGREGQGPGEYGMLGGLFATRGDTTLLWDMGNRRFLVIRPDGTVREGFSLPAISGVGANVRGVDAQGRVYLEGSSIRLPAGGGMPEPVDSVPFLRYDSRTSRTDTLGFRSVPRAQVNAQPAGAGGQMRVSIMQISPPFEARDGWAVTPDGRVAFVRAPDYRVDWVSPNGTRRAGQPVQYEKLRVTDAEKDAYRKGEPVSRLAGGSGMTTISMGGPGGGMQTAVTAGAMAAAGGPGARREPDSWPTHLPPFVATGVRTSPSGDLWVPRFRKAGDEVVTYDIFDATGRMTSRIALPRGSYLVGFGNGTAYVVRMDEDDLQYLQRFRL